MSRVPLNTIDSTGLLAQIHAAFGATPNMFKAVSNSPAALQSMWGSFGALGGGNMRDPENGVITIHTGIRGDADAPASWNFDPALVAQVTLTPVALAP